MHVYATLGQIPCPYCDRPLSGHAATDGPRAPKNDDWCVCSYCGRLSIFVVGLFHQLSLRLPTAAEEVEFRSSRPGSVAVLDQCKALLDDLGLRARYDDDRS
jgi:hypothetical protein